MSRGPWRTRRGPAEIWPVGIVRAYEQAVVDDAGIPPRRLAWALALTLAVAGLGCESCGSTTPRSEAPDPPLTDPAREVVPDPTPPAVTPPVEAPPDPPAEPAPELALTSSWGGEGASLRIANRTTEPARFAAVLVLERVTEAGAEAVADRGVLRAHLDADRPLPDCAELVPGAHLELVYAGLRGEGCTACEAPPPGSYRFVLTSCDGRSRTEGPSFPVP
jgi:hypothetical protein